VKSHDKRHKKYVKDEEEVNIKNLLLREFLDVKKRKKKKLKKNRNN
jgi:hypothetical protein